jgi:four helix bundle protein
LRVIKLVQNLPRNIVAYEIGRQLLRSGTSVAANTRAAYRGRSKKEFLAKIGIVIEECDESLLWMELLTESNTVKETKLYSLMKEADELVSIFVSISKKNK